MSTPYSPEPSSTASSTGSSSYPQSTDTSSQESTSDQTQAVRPVDSSSYAAPSYAGATDYRSPYSDSSYSSSHDSSYGSTSMYPAVSSTDTVAATPVVIERVESPPPASSGSRVMAAFASLLIGLLLVAGGVWLLARYGERLRSEVLANAVTPGWLNIALAALGAVALFGAVVLNGWSPWATIVPGLGLSVVGLWAMISPDFLRTISDSLSSILPRESLAEWGARGWIFALGLVLLGASAAAVTARSAGRNRGRS